MIRISQVDKDELAGIEMVEPVSSKFAWLVDGSVSMSVYDDDTFLVEFPNVAKA